MVIDRPAAGARIQEAFSVHPASLRSDRRSLCRGIGDHVESGTADHFHWIAQEDDQHARGSPCAYARRGRCPWPVRCPRDTVACMEPDAAYKHIMSFAFMVEELLHWLVADLHGGHELVDALDFSTLARAQEQSVTADVKELHRHSNDMVWRVRFRDRRGEDAGAWAGRAGREAEPPVGAGGPATMSERWLYLVVMLEFQSSVDFLMPLRIRNYVDNFHMERWRGRRFRSTDRLAPVLPIVLYTGASRWSAARRVMDLVSPGATDAGHGQARVVSRADPLFSGDGYLWLDTLRVGADDLERDNAAALLAGLENASPDTVAGQVARLHRRLNAPELRELKEVMLLWADHLARRRLGLDLGIRDMAEVERLHDAGDLEAYFAARVQSWRDGYRAEGREAGREEGVVEGRAEGQRALLRRHAAMKFDAETAGRLGVLLDGVTNQEVFDEVLAAIVERDTPADLLERAAEVRWRAVGRSSPSAC